MNYHKQVIHMTKEATITSKGQITIPSHIRKQLDLHPQDKLRIEIKGDHLELRPVRKKDLMDLYQSVPSPKDKPTDLKEIRKSVQEDIGRNAAKEGQE